jgi:hypothetical protein
MAIRKVLKTCVTKNASEILGSFDFLKDEPELYSVSDIKKKYA